MTDKTTAEFQAELRGSVKSEAHTKEAMGVGLGAPGLAPRAARWAQSLAPWPGALPALSPLWLSRRATQRTPRMKRRSTKTSASRAATWGTASVKQPAQTGSVFVGSDWRRNRHGVGRFAIGRRSHPARWLRLGRSKSSAAPRVTQNPCSNSKLDSAAAIDPHGHWVEHCPDAQLLQPIPGLAFGGHIRFSPVSYRLSTTNGCGWQGA